jgi:hypothetical protein
MFSNSAKEGGKEHTGGGCEKGPCAAWGLHDRFMRRPPRCLQWQGWGGIGSRANGLWQQAVNPGEQVGRAHTASRQIDALREV